MLDHPLITGITVVAFLLVIGYVTKLDMADMTGLARKAAKKEMEHMANRLGYQYVSPRTPHQQGGMRKKIKNIEIEVDAAKSRIQVDFNRSLGMRMSSLSKNDFDLEGLPSVDFSSADLNDFFPLRGLRAGLKKSEVESALMPLVETFDNRKTKYVYIKDEYLRVAFEHRNYLPAGLLESVLPVLEDTVKDIAAVK